MLHHKYSLIDKILYTITHSTQPNTSSTPAERYNKLFYALLTACKRNAWDKQTAQNTLNLRQTINHMLKSAPAKGSWDLICVDLIKLPQRCFYIDWSLLPRPASISEITVYMASKMNNSLDHRYGANLRGPAQHHQTSVAAMHHRKRHHSHKARKSHTHITIKA